MLIRIPPGMRDRIAGAAKDAGRSMNAEVIARLEKSFEDDGAAQALATTVEEHENLIEDLLRDVEKLKDAVGYLAERS